MAVQEQTPYIEYTANGVATSFALGFDCESKDHLIVTLDGVEPPVGNWSLTDGVVVFTTAPSNGVLVAIQRNTPFSRTTDYQSYNNSFRPPAVNNDFDRIWLKLQELGVADWILGARIDALKNYVDRKDDELKAYLMEEIRKQGVALDQLDEYYNYLMERLAQIAVDKGWDASFVVDASGKTQQEINNSLNGLAYAPDLPSNRRLQIIAGSVRNTGDGWSWISDSAHTPVGATPTVTVSGANIRINYGFTAKRVVSLIATPDETLATFGFIIGGSVGTSYTNLQIKAPLVFTVNTGLAQLTIPSYYANVVSATMVDGSCTVTHPSIGITGDAPALSKIGASGGHTDVLATYGNTQTVLHGAGNLDGQIIYDGTTWVYSGELQTIPTMEWVTSGANAYLRVTHSRTDVFNINVHSKTTYDIRPISTSGFEFHLRFYDAAGVLQLTPNTEMQFFFSRKACLPKNTIRGSYAVRRGYAGIPPSDLVSAAGNIWIYGVMEV